MSYTILAAQLANPDGTSAILETEEFGLIAISEDDTPDLWAALTAWGTPEPFVPVARDFTLLADVYERAADDAEADAIETAIDGLPALARNLIRTRGIVYHDEDHYTALKDALHSALSSERAELLIASSP